MLLHENQHTWNVPNMSAIMLILPHLNLMVFSDISHGTYSDGACCRVDVESVEVVCSCASTDELTA